MAHNFKAATTVPPPVDAGLFDDSWSDIGLPVVDNLRIAWHALTVNKLRAGLTMLGIIIGIFAVIAMISLGQSGSAMVQNKISALGTNLILVIPQAPRNRSQQNGAPPSLTLADADAIAERFPKTIAGVAPETTTPSIVKMGDKGANTNVVGTTAAYQLVDNASVRQGRFISGQDVNGRTKVAVVGATVVEHLLGDRNANPIGRAIYIDRIPFTIIGVRSEGGGSFTGDADDVVIIPVTTSMHRLYNQTWIPLINVGCASPDSIDLAIDEISNLLRQRHHLRPPFPDSNDFQIVSQKTFLKAFATIGTVLTGLLGGIGTISLLVGGIGIMNIMLVSVTERTREIGLRKAVGATRTDILIQFLIESMLLALVGGIIGIVFGIGIVWLVVSLAKWPLVISPWVVALATAVSAGIGIVFGSYPAAKAARLSPIDALRYE